MPDRTAGQRYVSSNINSLDHRKATPAAGRCQPGQPFVPLNDRFAQLDWGTDSIRCRTVTQQLPERPWAAVAPAASAPPRAPRARVVTLPLGKASGGDPIWL